jgi:anti-sigma factor RsiW
MPKCSAIDPLVTPFVDGELHGAERQAVEQHMTACPPCRTRIDAELAVRDLLHVHKPTLQMESAPPTLRARCGHLSRRESAAVPRRRWTAILRDERLEALAVAAVLVLIVAGAFVYRITGTSPRVMAAELAADHVKCFAMNAVLRTHHTPEVVESSMASGFGWHMQLPAHPERAGLELVGSRPCLYGEGKVAHIMYRHNGRPVSLFMLPRTTKSEQLVEVLGHEAAIWSAGDRTFVLIARDARSEVERMADFVHATLETR